MFKPGANSLKLKSAPVHETVAAPVCADATAGSRSASAANAATAPEPSETPVRPLAFRRAMVMTTPYCFHARTPAGVDPKNATYTDVAGGYRLAHYRYRPSSLSCR